MRFWASPSYYAPAAFSFRKNKFLPAKITVDKLVSLCETLSCQGESQT
jgi:hypothetical protein